jgi:tetratricopeptide (TPR) repeat protein
VLQETKTNQEEVALDPDEDFKDVKDKSTNYRYYEHAEKGLFWDIDRYDEILDIWHGPIGKRGEQVIEEFEWASPAKEAYKEYCAEREDEGYNEASADGNTFLDAMEKEFGKLPAAYKTFMESGKFKKYNGFFVSGLPQFAGDTKFKVFFDESEITDLEVPKSNPKLLPICRLAKEELHYLAIDRSDKELAVWVVFQSDGPVRFMPSFEAFLASLFKKGVSPFKALEKAHKEAEKLRKQENYEKALSIIEGPLAAFPPRAKSEDYFNDSDDLRNVLAASYNLTGICLQEAGKLEEAATVFENAVRVKAIQVSSAPKLNLLDLYTYHLKDFKRAITYAKSFEGHDPNTRFYRLKALAFATAKSGDDAAATKLYEELKEVVGNDKKLQTIVAEELKIEN